MAELTVEQATLDRRQAACAAEENRQHEVQQYCRCVLRGLDRLHFEGRQKLLGMLVDDEIRTDGRKLEIRGILPECKVVNVGTDRPHYRASPQPGGVMLAIKRTH